MMYLVFWFYGGRLSPWGQSTDGRSGSLNNDSHFYCSKGFI